MSRGRLIEGRLIGLDESRGGDRLIGGAAYRFGRDKDRPT